MAKGVTMKASAGRVLMLVENSFPADERVRNEPFTLVSTGFRVSVLALQKPGKAIVSFDLAETRYSAQNAALYVQPNNEGDFAKAIATLMDNPELREKMGAFGESGRRAFAVVGSRDEFAGSLSARIRRIRASGECSIRD